MHENWYIVHPCGVYVFSCDTEFELHGAYHRDDNGFRYVILNICRKAYGTMSSVPIRRCLIVAQESGRLCVCVCVKGLGRILKLYMISVSVCMCVFVCL